MRGVVEHLGKEMDAVAEFTLTPDEPDLPLQPQRVRLVSSGLHPTEAVPASRRTGKDTPPCYQACEGLWDAGAAGCDAGWQRAPVGHAYRDLRGRLALQARQAHAIRITQLPVAT
jgi:hypothetical protein